MVVITLIGEHLAREGVEFVYRGPLTECRDCKLKAVCFNLDSGGMYRIKSVRDVHHECRIHEEGVRVVEVEKIPVRCAIIRKHAMEGSTITFEDVKCKTLGCIHYHVCHPLGLERSIKCKVSAIREEIDCPEGNKLVEVILE
jgi:uncharacterized protein (UPF0179 family)